MPKADYELVGGTTWSDRMLGMSMAGDLEGLDTFGRYSHFSQFAYELIFYIGYDLSMPHVHFVPLISLFRKRIFTVRRVNLRMLDEKEWKKGRSFLLNWLLLQRALSGVIKLVS